MDVEVHGITSGRLPNAKYIPLRRAVI
ncbi:hypothetical protein RSAG8_13281, partial [Rhizoctonia solani AG-8 WAC10335]